MDGSGALGGILGATLGLYVIHEVLHDGRTGRKLGVVHARNEKHAVKVLSHFKKLPPRVRVFPGKKVKGSHKKEPHYAPKPHRSHTRRVRNEFGTNFNVKMPRLF